jgi:hypothetical protein
MAQPYERTLDLPLKEIIEVHYIVGGRLAVTAYLTCRGPCDRGGERDSN